MSDYISLTGEVVFNKITQPDVYKKTMNDFRLNKQVSNILITGDWFKSVHVGKTAVHVVINFDLPQDAIQYIRRSRTSYNNRYNAYCVSMVAWDTQSNDQVRLHEFERFLNVNFAKFARAIIRCPRFDV